MTSYFVFIAIILMLLSFDYAIKREGCGVLTYIAIFIVVAFVSLRFEVGYDYLQYVGMTLTDMSELIDSNMEWGFLGIIGLLRLFDAHYSWLFLFFAITIIYFLVRGIKLYTTNVRIAFLVYLLIPGLFLNSFSILRQSLAIVIAFNAYYYLYNKKVLSYCFFMFLAVMFHYSVLIVIPFFWLASILKNRAKLILVIGIPLSLILAKINIVGIVFGVIFGGTKFVAYSDYTDSGTSLVKSIVLNVSVVPYLFLYNRMNSLNRSILVLITFGLMMLNIFSSVSAITRIGYYFRIFEIVLLANCIGYFKKGWSQLIFCVCIFIYFFIMFYSALSFDFNSVYTYPKQTPYKTFFESW